MRTRLNPQEERFKARLEGLPEFAMAGYQTTEMLTFRGVVIRRTGSVRGLWSYHEGHYRWTPVACRSQGFATPCPDRALRHMMLIVLKSLLVRRAVRRTSVALEDEPASGAHV